MEKFLLHFTYGMGMVEYQGAFPDLQENQFLMRIHLDKENLK